MKTNEICNGCKFQIDWNTIEWVYPKSRNVNINTFCTSGHRFYTKDKDMTCHWVGHSKMKPIDVDEFFNIKAIINKS